jgi:uncharacterized protein YjbJ (UPF0337 family)
MDWNRIEGNWKQIAGKIKEKWGKLTDDDLTQINGKREQFEGKIQEPLRHCQGSGENGRRYVAELTGLTKRVKKTTGLCGGAALPCLGRT